MSGGIVPAPASTELREWRGCGEARRAVEAWLLGDPRLSANLLMENRRRRVVCLRPAEGAPLLVKHYLPRRGHRGLRERIKAWVGQSPADREWRALEQLRAAGLRCPRPLGLGTLPSHGRILAEEFVEGPPLADALHESPRRRRALLSSVGALIADLHAAHVRHGDLHAGNIIANREGPVLVDLQRCRKSASKQGRLRDLGALDFSLAQLGLSRADRVRVRGAALARTVYDRAGLRGELRRVGEASARRAGAYYRSRTRRSLRVGRLYARVCVTEGAGLRVREFEAAAVEAAIRAHRALAPPGTAEVKAPIGRAVSSDGEMILKHDARATITAVEAAGRGVVVKEVTKGGWLRALADLVRGSPARRAWRGGHGLRIRGIGAAMPLAYVEGRRLGVPVRSLLICEDLRAALPLSELSLAEPDARPEIDEGALAEALLALLLRLHRRSVSHGDLQALHLYLTERGAQLDLQLIDLEAVGFPRRLTDVQRIEDLAALNSSLGDGVLGVERRRRAFRRYARALPFAYPTATAETRVVQRSLERHNAWRGIGCELSRIRP